MKYRKHSYSGTTETAISEREKRHYIVARRAAEEGIVLIKNEGVLPIDKSTRIALYGSGALYTIKGGTGSGDVNVRKNISIYEGLKEAGFEIANEDWLNEYRNEYNDAREKWKKYVLKLAEKSPGNPHTAFVGAYVNNKFIAPSGKIELLEEKIKKEDCAFYVISRQAGEGADRYTIKGDYYITDAEREQLTAIRKFYSKVVLILNCGAQIDLQFTNDINLDAIVYISQPGMAGGEALANIISGVVNPSGKLTDTWAKRYEDFPNALTFSHCNGDTKNEKYEEGIYVGYRYFDSFGITPQLPFGYGLSYTTFSICAEQCCVQNGPNGKKEVVINVSVNNTGNTYSGKCVVQIYASCPQGVLKKEYQRLCAFAKTPELKPGEGCKIKITFRVSQLTSFSEEKSAYLLEKGDYVLSIGESSADNKPFAVLRVNEEKIVRKVEHICPLEEALEELQPDVVRTKNPEDAPVILLDADTIETEVFNYPTDASEIESCEVKEFVDSLTFEQLISLTSGDPMKGHGASETVGSSGVTVPGSAGETHQCAMGEPWNLASMVITDGPAGLRLTPCYNVDANGKIIKPVFKESIEQGFFAEEKNIPGGKKYYQFCTGFPIETMLAQTWNTDMIYEVGVAYAKEMIEFGTSITNTPGVNIHRNPLCGRNFEYFSEDPLLSGVIATAMIEGMQSQPGVGATIKHMACNNQEDNRKGSNSIVSERTLREIYLHPYEIAIESAQPMALMPSYNLINGVHSADSFDLLTKAARTEWGFKGVVVSDWTTTGSGGASAVKCVKAGTDLIMPGSFEDLDLIKAALESGELDIAEVKARVANLVKSIWQTLEYEDCVPYSRQFPELEPYVDSELVTQ